MTAARIGIYGGAFDPPHLAHVGMAQAAVQQLQLDCLYVIPTGQPWMKQRRLTPAAQRLAMAELAFFSLPHVMVDDCEVRRHGITYTIDTLHELQQRHAHAEWFLVLGQDQLMALPQWHRAETLVQMVTVAVLQRADADQPVLEQALQQVRMQLPALRAVPLDLPASAASSTAIRNGLQQRRNETAACRMRWLLSLVPPAVAQYIEQHQLYFSTHSDGH